MIGETFPQMSDSLQMIVKMMLMDSLCMSFYNENLSENTKKNVTLLISFDVDYRYALNMLLSLPILVGYFFFVYKNIRTQLCTLGDFFL